MQTIASDFATLTERLTRLADAAATRTLSPEEQREYGELEELRARLEPKLTAKSANSAASVLRDLGVSPTSSPVAPRLTLGQRIVQHPAYAAMVAAGAEARSSYGFDVVLKDVTGSVCGPLLLPRPQMPPGPLPAAAIEPLFGVSDYLLNRPEDAPCGYFELLAPTGAPAVVPPGTAKPNLGIVGSFRPALYTKVAAYIVLNDEILEDQPEAQRLFDYELRRELRDAVDLVVLNNVASATQFGGLIPSSLGPDHAAGTETPTEAILTEVGLLYGASGVLPDLLVTNIQTAIGAASVLASTSGTFLTGAPALAPVPSWAGGLRVAIAPPNPDGSPSIANGTALIGSTSAASLVTKRGIRVDAASPGDHYIANQTILRIETRIALAITRPLAWGLVTGLPS